MGNLFSCHLPQRKAAALGQSLQHKEASPPRLPRRSRSPQTKVHLHFKVVHSFVPQLVRSFISITGWMYIVFARSWVMVIVVRKHTRCGPADSLMAHTNTHTYTTNPHIYWPTSGLRLRWCKAKGAGQDRSGNPRDIAQPETGAEGIPGFIVLLRAQE